MSNSDYLALSTCQGKHPFASPTIARKALKRGKPGLDVYRCRICGKWHIGNNTKGAKT